MMTKRENLEKILSLLNGTIVPSRLMIFFIYIISPLLNLESPKGLSTISCIFR